MFLVMMDLLVSCLNQVSTYDAFLTIAYVSIGCFALDLFYKHIIFYTAVIWNNKTINNSQ